MFFLWEKILLWEINLLWSQWNYSRIKSSLLLLDIDDASSRLCFSLLVKKICKNIFMNYACGACSSSLFSIEEEDYY